jgi:hypothetical protein
VQRDKADIPAPPLITAASADCSDTKGAIITAAVVVVPAAMRIIVAANVRKVAAVTIELCFLLLFRCIISLASKHEYKG